jgi:glycosyltransferase involved in cell wall biosynthesis
MIPSVSVILCTHNPRRDFLVRTLEGLRQQTMPPEQWELVLVDNASDPPLPADDSALAGIPLRIVREAQTGLTHARLAGIAAARAEVLVFVDDDNVLAADYLAETHAIAVRHPHLGAWGGACEGEFTEPPPPWARRYLNYLAVREVSTRSEGRSYDVAQCPFGAGLCLRRKVADHYAALVRDDPRRRALDRSGTSLMSGGDTDMVFTAVDLGLAFALEPTLRLKHLMPPSRLDPDYLEKLLYGISLSTPFVLALHSQPPLPHPRPIWRRLLLRYRLARQPEPIGRLERARLRGESDARRRLPHFLRLS